MWRLSFRTQSSSRRRRCSSPRAELKEQVKKNPAKQRGALPSGAPLFWAGLVSFPWNVLSRFRFHFPDILDSVWAPNSNSQCSQTTRVHFSWAYDAVTGKADSAEIKMSGFAYRDLAGQRWNYSDMSGGFPSGLFLRPFTTRMLPRGPWQGLHRSTSQRRTPVLASVQSDAPARL